MAALRKKGRRTRARTTEALSPLAHGVEAATARCCLEAYEGTLDLDAAPAVELTIQAASLDTKLAKRDAHLRSGDFFDVERHPQVRFVSDHAELTGQKLVVRGRLEAAGRQLPLELTATVRELDGELEIDASTHADHRELGMTWSPLGILRAPSTLIVRGRLVRP